MSDPEALRLDPETVLAAAFADHDFLGKIGQHEVHVQTSEPIRDGGTTWIVVDVSPNSTDDTTVKGATFRYRIEPLAE